MLVQVAPLLRLPRTVGVFDYELSDPDTVYRGSLVNVPFRRSSTLAVVTDLLTVSSIPKSKLRPINKVVSLQPVIDEAVLSVAKMVAAETFTSLATVLRSIVPQFRKNHSLDVPVLTSQKNRHTDGTTKLIIYAHQDKILKYYKKVVSQVLAEQGSTLLIFPTIEQAELIHALFPQSILFHHRFKQSVQRQKYLAIRQAVTSIVIGTRSAIFAPIQNLRSIVIHDEESDEHTQDEPSPRYEVRRVAMQLVKKLGLELILTSQYPSIAARSALPATVLEAPDFTPLTFVNLDYERRNQDYRSIPQTSLEFITNIISTDQNVLIIHPRRPTFGSLVCRQCGLSPTCPSCRIPLAQAGKILTCRHCQIVTPIPLRCSRCSSLDLRGRGRGIEHVVGELQQHWPNVYQTLPPTITAPFIVVSTPEQIIRLPDQQFSLAIITSLESILARPRVDANEKAYRLIQITRNKLTHAQPQLLIQGSTVAAEFIATIDKNGNAERELRNRERFGWPPIWKLIVLRYRQSAKTKSITAAVLAKTLRQWSEQIKVIGPEPSAGRSPTNPAGQMIVLRFKKSLPIQVQDILAKLDDSWTITIDPQEIR